MDTRENQSIKHETDLHSFLVKFIDEAETMEFFSKFPAKDLFGEMITVKARKEIWRFEDYSYLCGPLCYQGPI